MKHKTLVNIGGCFLILYVVLSIGIPVTLDVLTESQRMIYSLEQYKLFKVAEGSTLIHSLLLLYALSPLLLVPGVVVSYYAFVKKYRGIVMIGSAFAMIGILALTISLLMLPSMNWILVSHIPKFDISHQNIFIVTLMGMHSYIGIYVGDILGLGSIMVWFYIISSILISMRGFIFFMGLFQLMLTLFMTIDMILRTYDISPDIYSNIQISGLMSLWLFIYGFFLLRSVIIEEG